MGLFTKDPEAKARRTQEREEQQKKAKEVPTPYVHTPTHALNDALLSVPHAYKGTDKKRLKEAHQHRLEMEASAIAAGSDTNVTDIPAKYWQGQPLPAQFKAPTPAGLRKLALSRPSLKGKKIQLPEAVPAKKQSQTPVDEGYASGASLNGTGKRSRKHPGSAKGPSHVSATTQSEQAKDAEAGREAELERLRRRIRELEGKQMGERNEQGLASHPPVLTGATAQNVSSPKPLVSGPSRSTTPNVDTVDNSQSRTSSSERWKWLSSGTDDKRESDPTTSTPPSMVGEVDGNGVDRYDWAMHWARLQARTEEERAKLPPAINPQERQAPATEAEPCYASLGEFSLNYSDAPRTSPSSCSRGRRKKKTPERLGPGISGSNTNAALVQRPTERGNEARHTPTPSEVSDFEFGFGSTTTSGRPGNYSTRTVSRVGRAAARRKNR